MRGTGGVAARVAAAVRLRDRWKSVGSHRRRAFVSGWREGIEQTPFGTSSV